MYIVVEQYVRYVQNGVEYTVARLECDTIADLPLPTGSYKPGVGSKAHVVEDNSWWAYKSTDQWVLQEAGTAGYTKAEVDALLADSELDWFRVGTALERGDDLDDITNIGIYNVLSNADAGYISNLPASYGGRLEVFATIDNETYCKQLYICNDDEGLIYTRRKLSVGWSDWVLLTPKNVCFSVGTTISATADNPFDLNTLQTIGRYTFGATASANLTNKPSNMPAYGGEIIVERVQLTNRYRQTIYLNSNTHTDKTWVRQAYSGTAPNLLWSSWYLFEGTEVL